LATHPALEKLQLGGNGLTDKDAFVLAETKSLKWLDVRFNKIHKKGIEALRHNNVITTLFTDSLEN
jgi:hypothetical protein